MPQVQITQRRSAIGKPQQQKATLKALGLRRLHQSVQHQLTPSIQGMIRKVRHLVVTKDL